MLALQKLKTDVIECDYNNISRLSYIDCLLNILPNNHAEMVASVKAGGGTDRVSISIFLQYYNNGIWSTVKYLSRNYKNTYGSFNETHEILHDKKYRMLVNFFAYSGEYTDWMSAVVDG